MSPRGNNGRHLEVNANDVLCFRFIHAGVSVKVISSGWLII